MAPQHPPPRRPLGRAPHSAPQQRPGNSREAAMVKSLGKNGEKMGIHQPSDLVGGSYMVNILLIMVNVNCYYMVNDGS